MSEFIVTTKDGPQTNFGRWNRDRIGIGSPEKLCESRTFLERNEGTESAVIRLYPAIWRGFIYFGLFSRLRVDYKNATCQATRLMSMCSIFFLGGPKNTAYTQGYPRYHLVRVISLFFFVTHVNSLLRRLMGVDSANFSIPIITSFITPI